MSIFISYRRDDSGGYARAIYQHLALRFGPNALFMDVETLKPGRDFAREIESRLSKTQLMLVLVGKDWSGPLGGGGSRIAEAGDFVRLEVALALQRGIAVVPVLLGDASLPSESELPDNLKRLLSFQAVHVTHPRFAADMEAVETVVAEALGVATGWGRVSSRLRAVGRAFRTPQGIYWSLVAAYAVFASVVASTDNFFDHQTRRQQFGLSPAYLDGIFVSLRLAVRDGLRTSNWSWFTLPEYSPALVLLALIAVPILHRFRFEGYRRGLATGLWLQLVSQVVVLLLAAFITLVKFTDPSAPRELLPDSVLMYMSGGIGLVMLGVLFGVRRFCFDPASKDNAIIVEPT